MMIMNSSDDFGLERFWDLQSVGVSPTDETAKDNMLQQYINSCLTRDDDRTYVARFPWKRTHPVLPTNISVAECRTRHLVKPSVHNNNSKRERQTVNIGRTNALRVLTRKLNSYSRFILTVTVE